jgi:hypothetical protein
MYWFIDLLSILPPVGLARRRTAIKTCSTVGAL